VLLFDYEAEVGCYLRDLVLEECDFLLVICDRSTYFLLFFNKFLRSSVNFLNYSFCSLSF
jgi:hypothetical protein